MFANKVILSICLIFGPTKIFFFRDGDVREIHVKEGDVREGDVREGDLRE